MLDFVKNITRPKETEDQEDVTVVENKDFSDTQKAQADCVLEVSFNNERQTFKGNDHKIFSGITYDKITTKAQLVLTKDGKSTSLLFPPFKLKKLVVNDMLKQITFKQMLMRLK